MARKRGQRKRSGKSATAPNVTQANFNTGYQALQLPRLGPEIRLCRRVENLFDIVCDGINPSLGTFNFSLSDLPNYTDFINLFQLYRIDEIDIQWRPEYTELTDAALVSNAVNVGLNSCLNLINSPVLSVNDVLQNHKCSTTPITRVHRQRFRPMLLMDGTMPCACHVTCQQPTLNWYGISYGINPTGVAMTFRSTVVMKLTLSGPV